MSNVRYEYSAAERNSFNPKFLYLTKAAYGEDWHSTPHFHQFTEIIFVTKGSGTLIIDKHRCTIKRGDLVIINPTHMHTEYSSEANPLEYFIVGVDNIAFDMLMDDFDESDKETQFPPPVFDLSNHYEKTYYYLNAIHDEIMLQQANYQLIVDSMLTILLIYIMRHTNLIFKTVDKHYPNVSKECIFVKQYIDSHYAYDMNLDELSQKVFLNKYYLVHSFKSAFGMSPIKYLLSKRIDEAKSLLKTTDLSVSAITKSVGFSSAPHFTAKFKEEMGMSPLEYRKHCHQNK